MSNPIKALMSRTENQQCADCLSPRPDWASSTFGAFICLKCSGIHRGLGTHITLVRSCTLDSWTDNMLEIMEKVGNRKLNEYWECNLPTNFCRPNGSNRGQMETFIRQKYVEKKWVDKDKAPPHIVETQVACESEGNADSVNSFFGEFKKNNNSITPSKSCDSCSSFSGIKFNIGNRQKVKIKSFRLGLSSTAGSSSHSVNEAEAVKSVTSTEDEVNQGIKGDDTLDGFFETSDQVFDDSTDMQLNNETPVHKVSSQQQKRVIKKFRVKGKRTPIEDTVRQCSCAADANCTGSLSHNESEEVKKERDITNTILIETNEDEQKEIDDFFDDDTTSESKLHCDMNVLNGAVVRDSNPSTLDVHNDTADIESFFNEEDVNLGNTKKPYIDDAPNPFDEKQNPTFQKLELSFNAPIRKPDGNGIFDNTTEVEPERNERPVLDRVNDPNISSSGKKDVKFLDVISSKFDKFKGFFTRDKSKPVPEQQNSENIVLKPREFKDYGSCSNVQAPQQEQIVLKPREFKDYGSCSNVQTSQQEQNILESRESTDCGLCINVQVPQQEQDQNVPKPDGSDNYGACDNAKTAQSQGQTKVYKIRKRSNVDSQLKRSSSNFVLQNFVNGTTPNDIHKEKSVDDALNELLTDSIKNGQMRRK